MRIVELGLQARHLRLRERVDVDFDFDNDFDEQVGLAVARSRVGINGIEVLQAVMQSAAKRHPAIRPDLVRSPEQIRFGFLRRLGVSAVKDHQLNMPLNQPGRRVERGWSQERVKRFY